MARSSGLYINELLSEIGAHVPGSITLFRPVDHFCDDECPTMRDGLWLYNDGTHFTVAGSDYMVRRAESDLVRLIVPGRQSP